MKERRTFLLPPNSGLTKEDVVVTASTLEFSRHKDAAVERRMTLNVTDLPEKFHKALAYFDDLHIRFESPRDDAEVQSSQVNTPVVARLPPGLHIFFTPRLETNRDADHASEILCAALRPLLDSSAKCLPGNEGKTFTELATLYKRSGRLLSQQFYHNLVHSSPAFEIVREHLCFTRAQNPTIETLCDIFSTASYARHLDIDYDASANLMLVTAFWTSHDLHELTERPKYPLHKAEKPPTGTSLEIGVLEPQTAKNPEELSVGGLLTLVGEVDHASGTLFSFPARHHPTQRGVHYTAQFQKPTGLHPKLSLTFPADTLVPPQSSEPSSCSLHAHWTLPSSLFIDRYQFSDPLVLSSQNLIDLKSLSGEEDLEAPDWAIPTWGSSALFTLAYPNTTATDQDWTVTIPTHLRYMTFPSQPEHGQRRSTVEIPWPTVFWACGDAQAGLNLVRNPFDRRDLGYDGLFAPDTLYYHVPPAPGREVARSGDHRGVKLMESLEVPTLDAEKAEWVTVATAAVVLVGFLWICSRLLFAGAGAAKSAEAKKKDEKKVQ